jgi:general transcription factor 3C polypeptide 3 (transcription factor C subunit 4)
VWNLLNRVAHSAGHDTHHIYKFVLRCLQRNPTSVPCMVLMGHHAQMAGSAKLALGQYLRAHERMPGEPLINLLIAVVYISHVMSRRCEDRHRTTLNGFSFLVQYAEQRRWSQEAYYNLGRGFHQLSLLSLARRCYEHALLLSPQRIAGAYVPTLDLRRECAYNLALIAKSKGAPKTAAALLARYCVF